MVMKLDMVCPRAYTSQVIFCWFRKQFHNSICCRFTQSRLQSQLKQVTQRTQYQVTQRKGQKYTEYGTWAILQTVRWPSVPQQWITGNRSISETKVKIWWILKCSIVKYVLSSGIFSLFKTGTWNHNKKEGIKETETFGWYELVWTIIKKSRKVLKCDKKCCGSGIEFCVHTSTFHVSKDYVLGKERNSKRKADFPGKMIVTLLDYTR